MSFLLLLVLASSCAVVETGREGVRVKNEVSHNGIRSTLVLEESVVTSGPQRFLKAAFEVENLTGESIRFTFPSSQETDYSIEDEAGTELWRWSEDKFFAQMIVEKVLADQPWVYKLGVPTVDRNGEPLAAGEYRLRVWLAGDQKIENRISFRVAHAGP